MTTPAVPTNRAQRRASGRAGASRKPVIAGSLLTLGGLFGAYLGYIRPPAAFAVTGCPTGSTEFNGTGDSAGLQALIRAADPGDTICITGGFTMDADITITSSITLIGDDSGTYPIIDGAGNNGVDPTGTNGGFDLVVDLDGSGVSVTVKYLELYNLGYALALCGEATDTLTVTNSTISDSNYYALRVQTGLNGPVTCTDSDANIIIQDSTITGGTNQLLQNGDGDFTCTNTTLSDMTGYLYILDTGALSLDNCTLTNIGKGGSAALILQGGSTGTVSISDSDFTDNANGAIETLGDSQALTSLTITGSTFTGNGGGSNYYATVGISVAQNLNPFTISGSSFTNNTPGKGGTLFVYDSGPNLYIKDTQFTGNVATSGNGTFPPSNNRIPTGAALYSYGNLKMRNVDFTGNKTIGSGTFPVASAIGVRGNGPIMDWDDVVVTGNGDAGIDRPAVYFNDATGTITNSRFSGNFGSGAVKDLRITYRGNYDPLTSITSTSVSSRSTVSIAPGSVTTVSLTYLDEVPVDNGGGSGGGSTPVVESTPTAAPTTPTQDAVSTPAPVTFADPGAVTPSEVSALTPAQVALIPAAQFRDLPPAAFGVLTAAQMAGLPIDLVRAIRPARMAALTPEAVAGMSGEQLSALRLASMRAMSPAQVGAISSEVMRTVAPAFLAQLKPKVLAALGSDVMGALSPEQVPAIRRAALAKLPAASLRALDPASFAALTVRQASALTPRQVALLTNAQVAALNTAQRRALRRG